MQKDNDQWNNEISSTLNLKRIERTQYGFIAKENKGNFLSCPPFLYTLRSAAFRNELWIE